MSKRLNELGGLPMFDEPPPPPPTGPEGEEYEGEDNRPPAFMRLLRTTRGQEIWASIERAALKSLSMGETRFSTRGFIDTKKVGINNAFAPWFSDMLVAKHPELLDIVERRRRSRPGPFSG